MTIEQKELLRDCRKAICILNKAARCCLVSMWYRLLSRCCHSISYFYLAIAKNATGKGKVKNMVFKHAIRKSCEWTGYTLENMNRCRHNIESGNVFISKTNEILTSVRERTSMMKEMV